MTLYHFTSTYHLSNIIKDGLIKTTESNASFLANHVAEDVVWLTSNKNPQREASLSGSIVDKKQVRITVNINAQHYFLWAKQNNVSEETLSILDSTGGGQANKWFVVNRLIPRSQWQEIEVFDYQTEKWVKYVDIIDG